MAIKFTFASLVLFIVVAQAAPYEVVNVNVSLPQNNSALDYNLAWVQSQLYGYNGATNNQLTHSFVPVTCGANVSVYHTDPGVFANAGTPQTPILLLNHGYPESSYIWRDVTPVVSHRVPVFVPDRPGYGLSTVCPNGTDEFTMASAILEAANKIYGNGIHVILGGHDRGARSMHRAAVSIDQFPNVNALGVWMADVVPIVEEYASFSNPNYSTNYFHWNFLPKNAFATDVIMAYGGGNWVTEINHLGSGINATATAIFQSGQSFEVYANFFNQLSVTKASVEDYTSGATTDYQAQLADQAAGRKIKMPTHVLYSYSNLVVASGFNVSETWSRWVEPSAGLTTGPVCCGQGHFIIELAPQDSIDQLDAFMDRLGVAPCCAG
ncbi:Alpha/Beta hydrolase protein [Exophiala viscosa]|uniref:Alpha/Beta hydrolase protein n=1 Tax=Exophiala viscosa TaxID=2486360 RepID=A0AAN6DSY0_9EURO|nr:Alpha/Beta hydrolase protein [Exophiala viscosa]